MVEPKQKPAGKPFHTADKARIPRTAMRAAWLRTREGTRRLTAEEQQDGHYREAASLEECAVDTAVSAAEAAAGATLRGGKRVAQQVAQKRQTEKATGQAEQAAEQATGAATRPTTSMPVEPSNRSAGILPYYNKQNWQSQPARGQSTSPATQMGVDRVRRGKSIDLHQSRLHHDSQARFQVTTRQKAKPRPAPLPKTSASAASKARAAATAQTKAAKVIHHAKQAAQAAETTAKKVADVVMAGLKALWAATQTLAAAIAAGGTTALLVIVVLCMVAMVAGSAFGIFFAAEPTGDGVSVAQAITELNEEYQERLQEIEGEEEYDRQEIESNDGSYAIAWQDVLAVFAAHTSGAEDGAPVAYLDEENLERLRQIMWDMNEITWEVEAQTHEVETTLATDTTDDTDEMRTIPAQTTVTEIVLILTLHHKTAEEMREEYHFNARQDEYLTLLSAEDAAPLWADLLGGFGMGELGGEILSPGSDTTLADGALQWPLPVAGTITSPQGYRRDPITGETSYHSGTDIAVPRGHPDPGGGRRHGDHRQRVGQLGGSYGYHVKLDHGGGLTTLYAHCSSICVTAGQQVTAGQVIAYVGHTGRATGPHLHFEVQGLA